MSKHWEPCPRCESKKVTTRGKGFFFLVFLGTGSVLFWVGFLIPFFWIAAAAFLIGSPLAFMLPKVNQCQDCKHSWKVDKKKEVSA
jgi:hypothetical protein